MQPSIRKLKVFEKTKITITKTTKTLEKEEQRLHAMYEEKEDQRQQMTKTT